METRKLCTVCNEFKGISYFPKNSKGLFGVGQKCKVCSAKQIQEYRKLNPYKAASKKYSISEETVKSMWEHKTCMICGSIKKNYKNLCIDHNHSTGKVRGVLCDDCNIALGKFKDSQELLTNAVQYLEKYKEN
jgi:hypothetical protein